MFAPAGRVGKGALRQLGAMGGQPLGQVGGAAGGGEGGDLRPDGEPGLQDAPGDGEVELQLVHSSGILELYYGSPEPAKVALRTDGVLRSSVAKEYNAGQRLYGLVESQLFWVLDMAAVGQPLQHHLAAELRRATG